MLRPREQYSVHGPSTLSDEVLLAVVIGTGVASGRGRSSAQEIGRQVLDELGGLDGLARAPVDRLARVPGLGPVRALRLHAALALGRRVDRRSAEPPPRRIQGPADAWSLLAPLVRDLEAEELHAIYLGPRGQVRAHRCLTRGSDRYTVVDPRQVYRAAIELGVPRVLVAHNHPSGDPCPSGPDIDVTRRLADAGRVLGIQLVDHLVLGRDGYTSLAEEGLLPGWAEGPGATG